MRTRTPRQWLDVLLDTAVDLERRGLPARAQRILNYALKEEDHQKDQAEMLEIERDWRN